MKEEGRKPTWLVFELELGKQGEKGEKGAHSMAGRARHVHG